MVTREHCAMLAGGEDLDAAIGANPKLLVLVYADWCPFSLAFLPDFLRRSNDGGPAFARVLADDRDPGIACYKVEVYPSILYFENGRLADRLDGIPGSGLNRLRFEDFIHRCGAAR
jgi:thioredoxin-like negative regulator of GroEL